MGATGLGPGSQPSELADTCSEILQVKKASLLAEALGRSGYATDPAYAAKIKSVLSSDALQNALQSLKVGGSGPIT